MQAHPAINFPRPLPVWPETSRPFHDEADDELPQLTYYLPSDEYRSGLSMLILPGGGYGLVSTAKEGHRPAQYLAAHGIAAGVLEYRHSPQRHPVPLCDAQRGLRILRRNAIEHDGLDPSQVGCMGFSAGGHLAGLLATQPEVLDGRVGDAFDNIDFRPDFFAMIYAVITFGEPFSHQGSQRNLIGADPPAELVRKLSIEKCITPDTPPCFITHGGQDPAVPVDNALALYRSLQKHQVPATMFLFEHASHGIGLANNHPWASSLLHWLTRRRP